MDRHTTLDFVLASLPTLLIHIPFYYQTGPNKMGPQRGDHTMSNAKSEQTLERAFNEEMEVEVQESGNVEVINGSHEEPEEHVYHVVFGQSEEDGETVPKWCLHSLQHEDGEDDWEDCPAKKYGSGVDSRGFCKHMARAFSEPGVVNKVEQQKDN